MYPTRWAPSATAPLFRTLFGKAAPGRSEDALAGLAAESAEKLPTRGCLPRLVEAVAPRLNGATARYGARDGPALAVSRITARPRRWTTLGMT
jgi:hypothetical protein